MNKLYYFLFFLLLTATCQAQFMVRGKITDYSGISLPMAAVVVKTGGQMLRQVQTDSTGYYSIDKLKAGNYTINYMFIGFTTKTVTFYLAKDTALNIALENAANSLQEIQVTSKKVLIERKTDRTVFNVENSIAAIGTDAMELLSKVPGVKVINDRVSLVGKGGVNVLINDRLIQLTEDDLANYLKSIPSANISKIEVITNPPAKYDAQGNNGLLNIVLKKITAEGFRGSVNGVLTQANYTTGSAGGNISFRKDKLTLYTNFNIRKGSIVPLEQSQIFYPLQTWNIMNKDRNFRTVPSGQIGADYQVGENMLIGVSYSGGLTDFHSDENIRTNVFGQDGKIDSVLNSNANAFISSHYNSANLYVKQVFDTIGKQLVVNADWFAYNDDKERYFDNTSYDDNGAYIPDSYARYLSSSKQNIDLYTLMADLDLPYKYFKLAIGTKLSFIKNQSDMASYQEQAAIYQPVNGQVNQFNYTENTQALYFNISRTFKKWDFQAGLRGEYTQTTGISANSGSNNNNYLKLFPTAFLSYHLNSKNVFSINYGRRINRPAYKKLNPFRWYSNQYAYAEGNPFLAPSYNNNFEISHTYGGMLTTTLSLSQTNNGYSDVNFVEVNTNTQVSKPVNFITGYNYGLSSSITVNPLKWIESNNQVNLFYNVSNSVLPQTALSLKGFGAYLSTANQFTINKAKTLMADLSFWYQFPGIDGLNKELSIYNLDLGIKTMLINKSLQVGIAATDLLRSNKQCLTSVVNNIRQVYNNYYDNRQFRLSIRYNFGNDKIKQQNRLQGNEEERRRSN